jgi:hypothetical protein
MLLVLIGFLTLISLGLWCRWKQHKKRKQAQATHNFIQQGMKILIQNFIAEYFSSNSLIRYKFTLVLGLNWTTKNIIPKLSDS